MPDTATGQICHKIIVLLNFFSFHTLKQVSAYILGEFGHLLSRRPGCGPKELFGIIHEKLPSISLVDLMNTLTFMYKLCSFSFDLLRSCFIFRTSSIPILLSTYAKILMHTQPPDPELQSQIWTIFNK